MFEDEIEFFDDITYELNDLKNANRTDETFREFVKEHGAQHTLYLATTLHREVADQLLEANKNGITEENKEWRAKAVRVVAGVKKRRQQLRRIVVEMYGQDVVDSINQQVIEESEDLN